MKRTLLQTIPIHALIVSLILHLALFVVIGGTIIFEGPLLRQGMLIDDVGLISQDPTAEDILPEMELQEPEMDVLSESEASAGMIAMPKVSNIEIANIIFNQQFFANDYHISLPRSTATEAIKIARGSIGFSPPRPELSRPIPQKIQINNFFGSDTSSEGMLMGTFYDLKQTKERQLLPAEARALENSSDENRQIVLQNYRIKVREFLRSWNPSVFKDYYEATRTLSTPFIFMPKMEADDAPKAFKVQQEVAPQRWVIHYKGKIVAPNTGKFRFVGIGDDILVVRLANKNVLDASIHSYIRFSIKQTEIGQFDPNFYNRTWPFHASDWLELKAGVSYPIEILIGEQPGWMFYAFLMIEQKGVTYKQGTHGIPALPIFRTRDVKLPRFDIKKSPSPQVLYEGPIFGKE